MFNTLQIKDQRFGRWIALEDKGPHPKHNAHYWMCLCDCGTKREVRGSILVNGQSKSCGCWNIDRLKGKSIAPALPFGHAARNMLLHQYKRAAKKCNRCFSIPKEDFYKLTASNCFYCGVEPKQILKARKMNGNYIYNGLDRIDNDKGYSIENVVPCCIVCNRAKRCMTDYSFKNWILRIVAYHTENPGLLKEPDYYDELTDCMQ